MPEATMLISGALWRAHVQRRPEQLVASVVLRVAILALALFHAGLLRAHLLSGQFFEPAVTVRWVVGALIVAAFLALYRRGIPLLCGRRAFVLWLLVVLLHWSASFPASTVPGNASPLPATVATTALPTALAPLVTGFGLALLVALKRRDLVALRAIRVAPAMAPSTGATLSGSVLQISSRPPPA